MQKRKDARLLRIPWPRHLIGVAICVFAFGLAGPIEAAPWASDFSNHHIAHSPYGPIDWHLDNHNQMASAPLIVFLQGSGSIPLFQTFDDGSIGYSVSRELLAYMDRAHILLIDKPGVPFQARVAFDNAAGRPIFKPGPEFRTLTRQGLVERAAIGTNAALKMLGRRATKVVLIGYSEGAQYVFELARRIPATTHAVAIAGIALPQYYDFVIEARLAAERGQISRDEAQRRVEDVYKVMADVAAAPSSGRKWEGEDYRRWATFGPYTALDDMLKLKIPLLMVYGGADRNAPILNADFAKIAFMDAGKSNLDYWVYPNADHMFREPDKNDPRKTVSRLAEVYRRIWEWVSRRS